MALGLPCPWRSVSSSLMRSESGDLLCYRRVPTFSVLALTWHERLSMARTEGVVLTACRPFPKMAWCVWFLGVRRFLMTAQLRSSFSSCGCSLFGVAPPVFHARCLVGGICANRPVPFSFLSTCLYEGLLTTLYRFGRPCGLCLYQ